MGVSERSERTPAERASASYDPPAQFCDGVWGRSPQGVLGVSELSERTQRSESTPWPALI